MAKTFAASRAQLINYLLCLPLAVLVGYLLSGPTDPSNVVVVALVVVGLSASLNGTAALEPQAAASEPEEGMLPDGELTSGRHVKPGATNGPGSQLTQTFSRR